MADNDHLERQIEFIINNQAQFSTDIQQLKDLHKQAEQRMTKLEDVCLRLGNALVNLAETTTENASQLSAARKDFDERMTALAASQEHTDQRLSALIDIVMPERTERDQTSLQTLAAAFPPRAATNYPSDNSLKRR